MSRNHNRSYRSYTTNRFSLRLEHPNCIKNLNHFLSTHKGSAKRKLDIDVINCRIYSNTCAPTAALLDYYRNQGYNFNFIWPAESEENASYIRRAHIDSPLVVEESKESIEFQYPLNKVWKFSTSEGVSLLVSAFVDDLRKTTVVNKGILQSAEWCLTEIMDNVITHSKAGCGYAMAQYFPSNQYFAFCVFDTGVGIHNTFLTSSKYHPKTALDSITLALQEKVTSDDALGQGNGMWGLSQIIDANGGQLTVCTGGAKYQNISGKISTVPTGEVTLNRENGTTSVDFQIDCNKDTNVTEALGNYTPLDLWLDNHSDEFDNIVIEIASESSGTGTRPAGLQMRNIVINTLQEQKQVVLDFSGVNVVSSSYADELIGKLIAQIGFVQFSVLVQLKNLSPFNASVVNRSVGQRMAQLYYDSSIPDSPDTL